MGNGDIRPIADPEGVSYPGGVQALAIICPLDIAIDDRAWIEDLRARHDPQHVLVEAHFTLVFPTAGLGLTTLARHVGPIAERTRTVSFRLTRGQAVRDSLAPRSHVFLIPDEGDAEIRELHSALYGGVLESSLREDIPYQPHVTVAAFETQAAAEALADELGELQIKGRLRTMALMSVAGDAIRQEALYPLL